MRAAGPAPRTAVRQGSARRRHVDSAGCADCGSGLRASSRKPGRQGAAMLGEQSLHDDDTMDDETDQHPSGDELHADVRAPEQRADGQDHAVRIPARGNPAEKTVERPPTVTRAPKTTT